MNLNVATACTPERLKQAREMAGLSQAELSRRVHVNQTSISLWERGLAGISRMSLEKLAPTLQCSVDWLLGKEGAQGPPVSEWVFRPENPGRFFCGQCRKNSCILKSEVWRIAGVTSPNYCPWCGAKMHERRNRI